MKSNKKIFNAEQWHRNAAKQRDAENRFQINKTIYWEKSERGQWERKEKMERNNIYKQVKTMNMKHGLYSQICSGIVIKSS